MTNNLQFGDIILLKFPFTDSKKSKKRPALVLLDTEDHDIIVCRITSQVYNTPFDVKLENWIECGLKLVSVVRVHKLASLEKTLVDKKLGQIDQPTQLKVKKVFKQFL